MSKKMQPIEASERVKMAQLQKESSEKSNKVEWLYSGDKIDRDAYLLGKPIDKLLVEKEIEKPKEDFFSNTVDLANKIREDPLFEIKKQEIEAKKKLLDNPMRMKQIKRMIETKNNDSDSEEERYQRRDRNRDDRRYTERPRYRRSRSRTRSRSRSSDREDKRRKSKEKKKNKSRSRSPSHKHEKTSKYGLNKDYSSKRKQSSDEEKEVDTKSSSRHKEIEEIKQKIERLKQIRQTDQTSRPSVNMDRNVTKKMSEEEKQRRLQEMQENAKWRNDVRSSNIKKYKSDAKLEEKLEKESSSKNSQVEASNYFNNMMRDAYSSAEDRIKRNIKNIQKNQSSFDKNFARKY